MSDNSSPTNALLAAGVVGAAIVLLLRIMPKSMCKKALLATSLLMFIAMGANSVLRMPLEHIPENLSGKTYLVTGCTPRGIGYETARTLMRWNASTVVCTMRDQVKADALKKSMIGTGPGKFEVVIAELTSLDSVRQASEEIKTRFRKFDGVLLNAGLMSSKRQITKDGFEEMYQVNHLSQFLLLRLLENHLNPFGRVVFVSSSTYLTLGTLDRQVYGKKPGGRFFVSEMLSQWAVYMDTKLMNILSANAFAKRLASKQIRVMSVCPGLVASGFQGRMPKHALSEQVEQAVRLVARTPLQGAMPGLHLMTNRVHENSTGRFYDTYTAMPLSNQVTVENEEWLWKTSNELLGL